MLQCVFAILKGVFGVAVVNGAVRHLVAGGRWLGRSIGPGLKKSKVLEWGSCAF